MIRESHAPCALVSTERFEAPWYPGESLVTLELVEREGRTTVTRTMLFNSREIRDGVLQTGMEPSVERSHEPLEEILTISR